MSLPTTLDPTRLAVGHTKSKVVLMVQGQEIVSLSPTQARLLASALGDDAVLFAAMLLNSARASDEARGGR